jgi:hypothetical protein
MMMAEAVLQEIASAITFDAVRGGLSRRIAVAC